MTLPLLLAGLLPRDYIVLQNDDPLLDVPGGNALYAAVGLAIWESDPPPAVIARVGEDYPQEWLDDFTRRGLDTRGVRVLPQAVDVRSFSASPIAHHVQTRTRWLTSRVWDSPFQRLY